MSKLGFGKFARKSWREVTDDYLLSIIATRHSAAGRAKAEMDRRQREGMEAATVDGLVAVYISSHAVDRASLRLWEIWLATRHEPTNGADPDTAEGLHSWLQRMAAEARLLGLPARTPNAYYYQGIRFVFVVGAGGRVTLKSVMEDRETLPVNHPAEADKLAALLLPDEVLNEAI